MSFIQDFKAFALKGNVVDMAVGVIIGGAFGKIVTSIVNNIIMPPIGVLVGGVDFSDLKLTMKEAVMNGDEVVRRLSHGTMAHSSRMSWTSSSSHSASSSW